MSKLDTRLQSLVEDVRLLNENHDVCIAAIDPWLGIGTRGGLLHRSYQDLQFFKAVTLDRRVVMGRKTFESIPKRLERRELIVVSGQADYAPQGVTVRSDLSEALEYHAPAFIAGGGQVYREYLDWCWSREQDSFHVLTTFHVDQIKADTHYPHLEHYADLDYLEQIVIPATESDLGITVSLIQAKPAKALGQPPRVNRFSQASKLWCHGRQEGHLFFDRAQGQTFAINHADLL